MEIIITIRKMAYGDYQCRLSFVTSKTTRSSKRYYEHPYIIANCGIFFKIHNVKLLFETKIMNDRQALHILGVFLLHIAVMVKGSKIEDAGFGTYVHHNTLPWMAFQSRRFLQVFI